jgi:hypothetical protein
MAMLGVVGRAPPVDRMHPGASWCITESQRREQSHCDGRCRRIPQNSPWFPKRSNRLNGKHRYRRGLRIPIAEQMGTMRN